MNALNLLVESPNFELEYLTEKSDDKSVYIQGPYLMAEEANRNGRVYQLAEMVPEVDRYLAEMVTTKRALGELNHPSSIEVNPERACHMVTEMTRDGNIFYGKSKILNTPMGNIVKSLIHEGVKLGVSSRALGKLTPAGGHNSVSNFRLICADVVHDPSVPTAFVNGILESKQWVLNADGSLEEAYDFVDNSIKTLPVANKDEYLKTVIVEFLQKIKQEL